MTSPSDVSQTIEWRPIETAPLGGTEFLIWVRKLDDGAEFYGGMARAYDDGGELVLFCDTWIYAKRPDWYRITKWHPMPPKPEPRVT